MGKRKVTEQQKHEIWRLYNEDNLEAQEIAKMYNISKVTIYRIGSSIKYKDAQDLVYFPNYLKNFKDEIITKYLNGETLVKLASEFNSSCFMLRKFLEHNDIKVRNRFDIVNKKFDMKYKKEEIIKYYKEGLSVFKISSLTGPGVQSCKKIIKESGLVLENRNAVIYKNKNLTKEKLKQLYINDLMSIPQISKQENISPSKVSELLKIYKIKIMYVKVENLVGQKFGKLVVLKRKVTENNLALWECQCECGNIRIVNTTLIKKGLVKACNSGICNGRIDDISGRKFNKTSVVSFAFSKNGRSYWNCKCECGQEFVSSARSIKRAKSCCSNFECKIINIANIKFGKLRAIKFSQKRNTKLYWKCQCDCGKIIDVRYDSLQDGSIRSCGCARLITENEIVDILSLIYSKNLGFDIISHWRTKMAWKTAYRYCG